MAAESNVGARIFLIGKDAVLGGIKEITAATARLNAEIASGANASKVAAAGSAEQMAGLDALGARMDMYQVQLGAVNAETAAVASLGKKAFWGIAAAIGVVTVESVRWATAYQTQLTMLRTQAGLTVSSMNAIGAAAKANSAALGTNATAYVQAAYHPASTGMNTQEVIAITNYGAKLAAIGGADEEDTTNALTGVMKAYNMGKSKTAHTAALLNAIVGAGNMHYEDLNSALGSGVASSAKTFGVDLTSLGGALAYMTDRGVPAAQAGTRLRMAVSLLGAPSAQAAKFLTDAGLSSESAKDATNAMAQTLQAAGLTTTQLSSALRDNSGAGGIYNALELLHRRLAGSGMSEEMQAAFISRSFGGGRMGASIEAMYGNLPGLAQKSSQIERGATSKKFNQDWITTTKTFSFQMKVLRGEVHNLGISLGQELLPPLTKVVEVFAKVIGFLEKTKWLAVTLGGAVMAVLVPAIGVYLQRALLSSGGAISTVIKGYGRLLLGQSAEQAALLRTDAALGANDASLAANDAAVGTNTADLGVNDVARLGAGATALRFLSGAGGAAIGVTATAAGISLLGSHAQSVFNNQQVKKIKSAKELEAKIAALKKQMKADSGGAMGKIESWGLFGDAGKWFTAERIPGLENNTAGVEAKDKVLLSEYQTQVRDMKAIDPKAFDFTSAKPAQAIHQPPVVVHVYIDGKEITKTVTKRTKAQAARS